MIVLLDLEWIEKDENYLTQLSALRTDAAWNVAGSLDLYIKPSAACLREPEHMAFGELSVDRFKNGVSKKDCILTFKEWLEPDDVIWVWAKSNQRLLVDLWHKYFGDKDPPQIYATAKAVRKLALRSGRDAASPYTILSQLNIAPPYPEHRASNDVEAMRLLFSQMGSSMAQLPKVPSKTPTPRLTQRERNQRTIEKSEYNYVYLKNSEVFHRRGCKLCLNAKATGSILGSTFYDTAAKDRRPCKICKPVPLLFDAPISDKELNYRERQQTGELSAYNNEIIKAKMLDGSVINIKRGKVLGWCHHYLHKGALSKAIMTQHDCLGKNCPYLERNSQSPFWAARELEKESKEIRKAKIKAEKLQRAKEADSLKNLAKSWQSYLDDMESDMLIVRVAKESPSRYKIFYVSDNPFADGNRYPGFLDTLKLVHPHCYISLRHIRDVDGHFVTRDEYVCRNRK